MFVLTGVFIKNVPSASEKPTNHWMIFSFSLDKLEEIKLLFVVTVPKVLKIFKILSL